MTVRGRTRLLTLLLIVLGGGAVSFAGISLAEVMEAISKHAPLLALDGLDGAALMAGVGLLTIAVLTLLPVPDTTSGPRGRAHGTQRRVQIAPALMLIAGLCMIVSPLAPSIVRTIVGSVATGRGYARCPFLPRVRRQPDRWALPTSAGPQARCPTAPSTS